MPVTRSQHRYRRHSNAPGQIDAQNLSIASLSSASEGQNDSSGSADEEAQIGSTHCSSRRKTWTMRSMVSIPSRCATQPPTDLKLHAHFPEEQRRRWREQ